MTEAGLKYAELQFLWDKEVGDHSPQEVEEMQRLIEQYHVEISCISRHNFVGMLLGTVEVGDENHRRHMDSLQRLH